MLFNVKFQYSFKNCKRIYHVCYLFGIVSTEQHSIVSQSEKVEITRICKWDQCAGSCSLYSPFIFHCES